MNSSSITVALCRGALANGTALRLRIRGTSMTPALRSGDMVSVHRANLADVLPGEVVVFIRKGHLVAHRVVRRAVSDNGVVVVTRGDSCRHDDLPVSQDDFLGVVGRDAHVGQQHWLKWALAVFRGLARFGAVAPQYVARSTSVAARIDDGRMAIISPSRCEIVTLNEVAAAIWLAADGHTTLTEIAERVVCGRFDIEPHVARRDTERFVEELLRHGILFPGERPGVSVPVATLHAFAT